MIPNHYSAKLSELDIQMVKSVPPGGNWKNISPSIPSKRLEQIRINCINGNGSRSTYYGRLKPDAPSYTISTYFNRPGNGCFMHYDFEGGQHRLISQREAARLQSFPDNFEFSGNKIAINSQIGNAVPPLLAYQIASAFSFKGQYLDLFCGAGGLALGFHWAGWQQIVANDIDPFSLKTYRKNLGGTVIQGNICDDDIFQKIVDVSRSVLSKKPKCKKIVIGGPPCQGFSTAGNRRSMGDARNHLFIQYAAMLEQVKPDAFVFENVLGLLNMNKGEVLRLVTQKLTDAGYEVNISILKSEEYGVPQRRKRVFIFGMRPKIKKINPPSPVTSIESKNTLFKKIPRVISVKEALDDLPPIQSGEDGSNLCYSKEPENDYQRFCRGLIGPHDYINNLRGVGSEFK